MRKTSNLLIRQSAKKSSEKPKINTGTNFRTNPNKKQSSKRISALENLQIHKQMSRAENLTEEQHREISKEAHKIVGKKIRSTQTKIENELLSVMESECVKLGEQLQREKVHSHRLTVQVQKLRKNVQYLNEKLEKMYNDQSALQKNNIHGKAQKVQLGQEVEELRNALKRKSDQFEHWSAQQSVEAEHLQQQKVEMSNRIKQLEINFGNLKSQKEQVEEQLQEKFKENQQLRRMFEEKKKQWDEHLKSLQAEKHSIVERKGQKITKYQVNSQKMTEKLKQEETMRRKLTIKNQQLEKQIGKEAEIRKEMEQQISALKKRVNDLSILKSSNNTISNQKITKLTDQCEKLKKQIQILKGNKKMEKEQKPFLFGPQDHS